MEPTMRRTSFADMSCSIARSLDVIGEWWTLLIVREAFFGTRRFGEFQTHLGIAPNVLAQRLGRLVEHGVLEVTTESQSGRALDYRLTSKGRDLFPVIVALVQWGDRHEAGPQGPVTRIVERRTGQDIAPLTPQSADGRALAFNEVTVVAGPGAGPVEQARMATIADKLVAKRAASSPEPDTPPG
jgi:DNA-binding HxlR family transcriptional regulator